MTQLRVRARAVDMLGRQQIAGIPTAIHELFKNAHDAYAGRVEVDYFRETRVLILRDDGYGMTRRDLEERWLTLGTESRINANTSAGESDWRGSTNTKRRVIMGEKGIGRLAVGVIAPLTLLLTRALRPEGLHDLVVTLVHWGIFEQPGIEIGAINIPIMEFPNGSLPTNADIKKLADEVMCNLAAMEADIDPGAFAALVHDLECVRNISPDKIDATLNSDTDSTLSLQGQGSGTHFIVLPVAPELNDDIDGGADKEASKLERNLLGFSNFMRGDPPVIQTEFRDHQNLETRPLIGPNNFFTSEEFVNVDHSFVGDFDENGQFQGAVTIFGKPRAFVCNWTAGRGRAPRCGPFSLKFAHIHGQRKESSLANDDWSHITQKLDRIGGLYIYRDGIRILPYGNSDVDWLDIEKRRTKSASDWFFSFRRIFGYISISHEKNYSLSEKAGREGFRENQAYRDFRSILINFFEQLALEFFRETSPQGDDYWTERGRLKLQVELLEKQKKKADARRGAFRDELTVFAGRYQNEYFESRAKEIVDLLESELTRILDGASSGEMIVNLQAIETRAWSSFRKLANDHIVAEPKGLALGKATEREWVAYVRMSKEIRERVLTPLQLNITNRLADATHGRLPDAQRIEGALQEVEKERANSVKELSAMRKAAMAAADQMQNTIRIALTEEFSGLRKNMEEVVGLFTKRTAENPSELDIARDEVEAKMAILHREELSILESFKRQMEDLTEGISARETLDDRFAALEARNQRLEDQLDFYADFAQMGMAVGILQHEFERAANGIRASLGELKPWADRNPQLSKIYAPLRTHIEHLDGYFKAIDPLGRRIHRSTVMLSGEEILSAIRRVFSAALSESNIDLSASHAFREFALEGKSASLVGAFINLVDNAIYWINSQGSEPKAIYLDADEVGFVISNTGPGIEDRMREQIFELGVTKKQGGRGIGLAISRETLKRDGLELELLSTKKNTGPAFRIRNK